MKTLGSVSVSLLLLAQVALAASNTEIDNSRDSLKTLYTQSKAVSTREKDSPVRNFGKLNDHIWRSGQPTREGYEWLARQGLKMVVNLREEFPQDKDLLPAGVKYVFIPITDQRVPTEAQAKEFIDLAANPENWPLLLHCHGGEGRAGVMAALVRHSLDDWDHDMIMKEVWNFRVKHLGFIKWPMAGIQQRFIQNWEKTPNLIAS